MWNATPPERHDGTRLGYCRAVSVSSLTNVRLWALNTVEVLNINNRTTIGSVNNTWRTLRPANNTRRP